MPQVFDSSLSHDALGGVDGHAVVAELDQHFPQVLLVLGFVAAGNENIVQIDEREGQVPENLVHETLESLSAILHPERHPEVLEQPERGYNGCLLDVCRVHGVPGVGEGREVL